MHQIWRIRALHLLLFLLGGALSSRADGVTNWMADRTHPQVQYRLKCNQGALTIQWKNSYPGAVTLKFRVKGSNYDGEDDVTIPAEGSATSDPDTFYCIANAFEITEKRFSMAAPAPIIPVAANPHKPEEPKPIPTVVPWTPPAKVIELAPEKLALVHVGMKGDDVVRLLGDPTSKLSIPEETEILETYRYPVSAGRASTIYLSNGIVTKILISQP